MDMHRERVRDELLQLHGSEEWEDYRIAVTLLRILGCDDDSVRTKGIDIISGTSCRRVDLSSRFEECETPFYIEDSDSVK